MNLRFLSVFALFATIQGFCDEEIDEQISQLEVEINRIREETSNGNFGAKTASGIPQINGCGLFITGDFLWWKLYEGGTELSFKNLSSSPLKASIKHLNFHWEPGYKVGLGYLFDNEGWDLYLNFTSFKTHAKNSAASSSFNLLPLIGSESGSFSSAHAHWNVDFYTLDYVMGKNFFVSRYLSLHPNFGLISAWITQHRKASFSGLPSILLKLKSKNNFWGIGPKIATDIQYYLGRNFSLYGGIAGALLWGQFRVHEREKNYVSSYEVYDLNYNLNRMVSTLNLSLGLLFETSFIDKSSHFKCKLGYEGQYWWKQNQLPLVNSSSPGFYRQSEDLSMQGLTVDFQLNF